jgi:hypothetical protein
MSGNPQSAHDGGGFFGSEEELLAHLRERLGDEAADRVALR